MRSTHNNNHKEQIELIRKLAEEGRKFVNASEENEISEMQYLTVCNRKIYEYFLDRYQENFIFSSFSYLNYENKFSSVPYLFYSGAKYEDVNSDEYWKAVSWNTNTPANQILLTGNLNKIINDNYRNKNIGLIKELIWYLINYLIPDDGVLTVTELLLRFGKEDPRNFKIFQERELNTGDKLTKTKNKDLKGDSIERYVRFDLGNFQIQKIQNFNTINEVKPFLKIPDSAIEMLKSGEFNYTSTKISSEKIDFTKLTDEHIQSFKKLLNVYKQICYINPNEEYNFYFLRPITFYQDFRGVFLFGLNEKLDPLDILFIENLNYRILSDVIIKRITKKSEREQHNVRTQLVFSVGHFLKHKTNKVPSLLVNVKKNIDGVDISEENMKKLIHRDLKTAKLTSERIHKLALIIDIIAKSFDGKNYYRENDIKNKEDYFTTEAINLKELIQKVHNEDYEGVIDLKMDMLPEHFDLEIDPFIYNEALSKNILPSHLFYEEILTEIFENCKLKAKQESNKMRELQMAIETLNLAEGPFKCLVLTNKLLDKTQFEELEGLIPKEDEFKRIDENIRKFSGIIFLDTFLNATETGYLLFKRSSKGDRYFFSVALKLESLKIKII